MNKTLKYKMVLISAVLSVLSVFPSYAQKTISGYPDRYADAFGFYFRNKQEFDTAGAICGLSGKFLFAIVAPELSRGSVWRDAAETIGLKTLYVNAGEKYADFSIGPFQMKPSFAEFLEGQAPEMADTREFEWFDSVMPETIRGRPARAERVRRLESVEFQMKYLILFCIFTDLKFSGTAFSVPEEKLLFFASAYNVGPHHSIQYINEISVRELFPLAGGGKGRYRDLSLWFYNEVSILASELFIGETDPKKF